MILEVQDRVDDLESLMIGLVTYLFLSLNVIPIQNCDQELSQRWYTLDKHKFYLDM